MPPPPPIVCTSRTISNPGDDSGTMNALLRACAISASGSVRAMTIAKSAPCAPDVNHLWPLMTHSSPSCTALVWICVGSEPATSGSVIEKHDRIVPSQSGRNHFSF
jgi:hypothetical protein